MNSKIKPCDLIELYNSQKSISVVLVDGNGKEYTEQTRKDILLPLLNNSTVKNFFVEKRLGESVMIIHIK